MAIVDELTPVGQFSGLTWLSPKALRLYQTQGLMEPAWVDPDSGYRYYRPSKVRVEARIGLLRRAGISLAGIAAFLASPTLERVQAWLVALDDEVAGETPSARPRHPADEHRGGSDSDRFTDAGATKITLQRAIPVLASLDLEATQRFYAEKIGFTLVAEYPDYAISSRDGVQLHSWLTDDPDVPKETSCRIDVLGIEALYEELSAAGVIHPNGTSAAAMGIKEFATLDGDGNLIKFGERTDGPA